MIQIAVINASTVVNDLDVKKMVDAIQVQIDRDWTPAWGIPAKLTRASCAGAPVSAAGAQALTCRARRADSAGDGPAIEGPGLSRRTPCAPRRHRTPSRSSHSPRNDPDRPKTPRLVWA